MKHDELVKKLRGGCDANTAFLLCYEAADAIVALQARVAELEASNKQAWVDGYRQCIEDKAAGTRVIVNSRNEAIARAERAESDLAAVRADQNIACTALCPHGLDIAAQHENAKRKLSEARSCLMELRMRFHAMGRRPEECYEMSIIDAALSEGSKT